MSENPRPRTLSVAIRRLEAAERAVSRLMGELAEARDENAEAQKRIAELEADLNNEMQWATHYCEEMTKAQAALAAALRREGTR